MTFVYIRFWTKKNKPLVLSTYYYDDPLVVYQLD